VTKQNPRPRKYASDAERQAAYRSRAAEVCVRLEPKTMATLDSIAEEIGYSRNELMQSMVKFGLTNRDWRNEGLTAHKRLPRYQENPGMATKPPSAAQLAARARFAEMARSGSLNRKRQIAAKKNASVKKNPVGYKYRSYLDEYATKTDEELRYIIKDASEAALAMRGHSPASEEKYLDQVNDASTILYRRRHGLDEITAEPKAKRKRNPAKKTVSQKISQLVNEGYPQKQAVAVALNEQRAGKVKRNPRKTVKSKKVSYESSLNRGRLKSYVVRDMEKSNDIAEFMSKSDAMKYARDYSDKHDVQVSVRSV
jgi:predicted transcriptional regulator